MSMAECKYCISVTKYYCLKCDESVCNMSFDCSIFAFESYPRWTAGEKWVALCKWGESTELYADDNGELQHVPDLFEISSDEEDREEMKFILNLMRRNAINCASRGYHEYSRIWQPRIRYFAWSIRNCYLLLHQWYCTWAKCCWP